MRSSPVGKLWFVLTVCAVLLAYASVGFGLTQKVVGTVTPDYGVEPLSVESAYDCPWHTQSANCGGVSYDNYDGVITANGDGKYVTTKLTTGVNMRNLWHVAAWDTSFWQESGYDVDNALESVRVSYSCGPAGTNGLFSLCYFRDGVGDFDYEFSTFVNGLANAGWRTTTWQEEDIANWGDGTHEMDFPWTTDAQRNALKVEVWGYHESDTTAGSFAINAAHLRWYVWE